MKEADPGVSPPFEPGLVVAGGVSSPSPPVLVGSDVGCGVLVGLGVLLLDVVEGADKSAGFPSSCQVNEGMSLSAVSSSISP